MAKAAKKETEPKPSAEAKPKPSAGPVVVVLLVQAGLLCAVGMPAAAADPDPLAAANHSSSIVGCAGLLLLFGTMTIAPSYKLYMIGVHLALLFQAFLVLLFGAQAIKTFAEPDKAAQFNLWKQMGIVSAVSLEVMRRLKPKKAKAEAAKEE